MIIEQKATTVEVKDLEVGEVFQFQNQTFMKTNIHTDPKNTPESIAYINLETRKNYHFTNQHDKVYLLRAKCIIEY